MKTLSLALLLMASMTFVLLGCSDNSATIAGPTDQTVSRGVHPTATGLDKSGPVLNSVSGNAHNFIRFTSGTHKKNWDMFGNLRFSAKLGQDNIASGNICAQYVGALPPPGWFPPFSGKIFQLKVEDNPGVGKMAKVMFEITDGAELFPPEYGPAPVGCMVVVDGGEGGKPLLDCTVILVCIDSPEVMDFYGFYGMSPIEYAQLMELWWGASPYLPIDNGNIQVR
jgi:hypothetical protein